MLLTRMDLLELPARRPDCPKNEDGMPLLPPSLPRSMGISSHNCSNLDELIQHFESLDYTIEVSYTQHPQRLQQGGTINVLCYLKDYVPNNTYDPTDYSLHDINDLVTVTRYFREGVHQLSNKIWGIRRTKYSSTELQCRRDMGDSVSCCSLAIDYCFGNTDYYIFMVDVNF